MSLHFKMIAGWLKIEVDLRTDDRDDQAGFPGGIWWERWALEN